MYFLLVATNVTVVWAGGVTKMHYSCSLSPT